MLILKQAAHRDVLHPSKDLAQYITRSHRTWYRFAQDVFRLDLKEEDIIFVHGSVKTAEWALAAATQRAREGSLLFGGEFGPLARATFSVSASRSAAMSMEHRSGPKVARLGAEDSLQNEFDQCVFLHYYKIKRRRFLGPKVIRAAGERSSSRSPPSSVSSSEMGERFPADVSLDRSVQIEEVPPRVAVSTSCKILAVIPNHVA